MMSLLNVMRNINTSDEVVNDKSLRLVCRLQLLDSVRCPKWHMDYVKLRLVKTYYGTGTQFIDPSDMKIRFLNYLYHNFPNLFSFFSHFNGLQQPARSAVMTSTKRPINDFSDEDLGFQLSDQDADKIQTCRCGDILVMTGRSRKHHLPVLHRSPPQATTQTSKRLLFSITIA